MLPPEQAQRTQNASPTQGRRVLLVEDDFGVRNATRILLKAEGFQVTVASSCAEALQKARETGFDLVVCDYHLGEAQTGLEVIASLRATMGAQLNAILMTGDTSSAIKEMPLDTRLRLASKPIQADQLIAMMRRLLES